MDISRTTQSDMYDDNNFINESSVEINPLRWRPEISFNDYMYEIHTNGLFTIDHFDIAINEVKLKHMASYFKRQRFFFRHTFFYNIFYVKN